MILKILKEIRRIKDFLFIPDFIERIIYVNIIFGIGFHLYLKYRLHLLSKEYYPHYVEYVAIYLHKQYEYYIIPSFFFLSLLVFLYKHLN